MWNGTMRPFGPIIFAGVCLLAACASKPTGEPAKLPSRRPGDSARLVRVVAEVKYYLSEIPPRMVFGEIYGDEAAVEAYGNTNLNGVVLEIIEPDEYAGKIYALHDYYPRHQVNHSFALGGLYEFRASVADIGKFSFQQSTAIPARRLTPEEVKKRRPVAATA